MFSRPTLTRIARSLHTIFTVVIVLAIGYALLGPSNSRRERRAVHFGLAETAHAEFDTTSPSKLSLLPSTTERSPAAKTAISKLTATPSEADKSSACYKQVRQQVENNHFIEQHAKLWDEIAGSWYYRDDVEAPTEPSQTRYLPPSQKFLLALARGGLLPGKDLAENDDTAVSLLLEVAAQDRSNSAPLLYAATIERRRGNDQVANEYLRMAERTTRFDAYVSEFSSQVFGQVKSSADLVQAFEMTSRLPVPDYELLRETIRDRNPGRFAIQLMSDGLMRKEKMKDYAETGVVAASTPSWMPVEYAVGKSILNGIAPNNTFPSYRDLYEKNGGYAPVNEDRMLASISDTCELSSLDGLVNNLRAQR